MTDMNAPTNAPPPPWARHATDAGLLVLRAAAGGLMLVHGLPKALHFGERAADFPDPLGVGSTLSLALAVFGEVVCSIAMALGLGTRFFAVPYAFTMLVAATIVHAGDPWDSRERAVLYLVLGLLVALLGPGRFSLDELIARRRKG